MSRRLVNIFRPFRVVVEIRSLPISNRSACIISLLKSWTASSPCNVQYLDHDKSLS